MAIGKSDAEESFALNLRSLGRTRSNLSAVIARSGATWRSRGSPRRLASGAKHPRHTVPRNDGFTYIGLLVAIVITGIGLAVAGTVSHTLQLREKERELLFVGDQFRRAIGLYYDQSPGGLKQYPKKLEDLLRDNRYPGVQRYLRKLYVDPLTAKKEWGLVETPGIGITGVYSLSGVSPVKTANFPELYKSFGGAKKYSDWKFVYVPARVTNQPAGPGQAGNPSAVSGQAGNPSAVSGQAINPPAVPVGPPSAVPAR